MCVRISLNVCVWWTLIAFVHAAACLLPGLCVSALLYTSPCVYNIFFFEEVPIAIYNIQLYSEGYTAREREKRESTPTITTISARRPANKNETLRLRKRTWTKNKKNKNKKEEEVQRRCKNKCILLWAYMYHCMYFMYNSSVRAQTHLIAFPLLFLSPFLLFFRFFLYRFQRQKWRFASKWKWNLAWTFFSRSVLYIRIYPPKTQTIWKTKSKNHLHLCCMCYRKTHRNPKTI